MRPLILILPLTVIWAHACTIVEGDRILGRDLALANPAYAPLPPDLLVGFSPMTGSQRVINVERLASIGRSHSISLDDLSPLCFERPTELLNESMLRTALEHVLGPGTKLEIADFSRYPIPQGELVFSVKDLPRPGSASADDFVTWRGHLNAGARSTAVVWAKVRVLKFEQWVEAVEPIKPHQTIEAGQIAVRSAWRFPIAPAPVREVDAVTGKQSSRSLSRGQMILPVILLAPNEVERGDTVSVELSSGAVSLKFTGYAETGGHRNDTVVVWVKDMGKRWRARVQEKGKVQIDADQNKSEMAAARRGNARVGNFGDGPREAEEIVTAGAAIALGSVSGRN